jgi:predicted nucleic acid-binding protein
MYDALLADPRISFMAEPPEIEHDWKAYTANGTFSPGAWNDAYLAAFAHKAGLQVITFDKGFSRFSDLQLTVLS